MKKFSLLLIIISVMATLSGCGEGRKDSANPFFQEWDTPYGVPPFDKIKVAHYMPAFEAAMKEHNKEIDAIVDNADEPSFDNVILALENSGSSLDVVANVFGLNSAAETDAEMQKVQEKIYPILSVHSDNIMMNEKLFAKIKTIYDNRASMNLGSVQLRLLEKTYKGFVRSGANLSKENKARLKDVNQELSLLSFKFGSNLLAENARSQIVIDDKDLRGIPSGLWLSSRNLAKEQGLDRKNVFTVSKASMIPFLTYSETPETRAQLYDLYIEKCNHDDELDNKAIINDIVRLRNERAKLLGYNTHAEFVLDSQMAKNPKNVYTLLDELWKPALERAKDELEELEQIRRKDKKAPEFASSDWWFYADKVRRSKYALDQSELSQYFSLNNVRRGAFDLANKLYGITFSPLVAPVYHKDCSVYSVIDKDGSVLGILYMDYYARPSKGPGAWCGEYRPQSYKDGKRVPPVVTIVCNFPAPEDSKSAVLLTLEETTTFFHEFGHSLHALCSDVPYQSLAGTNVERDFVELPSQIMENWAVEPEMLKSYALHYQSGVPISDDLVRKIRESAQFNQGFETVEYLAAAYSDMDLHNMKEYSEIDLNGFEKSVLNEKRGLIDEIEPRYRYTYFSHIFDGGYSAGYYAYIWSEVLDKDAFQVFVDSGEIFNRKIASRFREEVLSKGSTADGMTLYKNFRGAEPNRKPLMKSRGFIE